MHFLFVFYKAVMMIRQAAAPISSYPKLPNIEQIQPNTFCSKFYAQTTSSLNTRSPGFTIYAKKASLLNPQQYATVT